MRYSPDDVIALSAQLHLSQLTDASEYLQWSGRKSCSTRTVGWGSLIMLIVGEHTRCANGGNK